MRAAPGPARRFLMGVFLLTAAATRASADDAETAAMGRVRLTTDPTGASGCTSLGVLLRDGSVKDLRRKIVRAGGNTAVLSFGMDDIRANVFRCAPAAPTASPFPGAPPNVPPPPPGTPPPPPPGVSR